MSDPSDRDIRLLRTIAMWSAIFASITMATVQLLFIYNTEMAFWQDLVRDHFAATLGLTGAGIVSFAIVVFLRQTEGPIEFEAFGMKFRGASGQVILWAFLLIVYTLCAKILW